MEIPMMRGTKATTITAGRLFSSGKIRPHLKMNHSENASLAALGGIVKVGHCATMPFGVTSVSFALQLEASSSVNALLIRQVQ